MNRIAGGLDALGVRAGDCVGMLLSNRPEAHLVDVAALHLGATPFSIYNTASPEQIAYVLANADSRVVVTEQALLAQVMAAQPGRAAARAPSKTQASITKFARRR